MTVTDRHGKQIRGKVIYIQRKAERWRPQSADVHIATSDWLDPYGYAAIYYKSIPTRRRIEIMTTAP